MQGFPLNSPQDNGRGFQFEAVAATLARGSDRMIRRAQEAAAPAKALKSKGPDRWKRSRPVTVRATSAPKQG